MWLIKLVKFNVKTSRYILAWKRVESRPLYLGKNLLKFIDLLSVAVYVRSYILFLLA